MIRDFRLLPLVLGLPLLVIGQELWRYTYGAPGTDNAGEIAYGPDGNIYVAASCLDTSSRTWDFTVISLDTEGDERWVYRYDGPMQRTDEARGIVCGSDGYIYAAGYSEDSMTLYDITVVCLDTSGTERWVYRYDWRDDHDEAYDIIYGGDGNLYVTGWVQDRNTSGMDLSVISLDTAGNERWVYRFGDQDSQPDHGLELGWGPDGNLYVVGMTSPLTWDFTVISLTPDSARERWIYRYNGPGDYHDGARTLTFDPDGNVYAAGESWGGDTLWYDIVVIGLTDSGTERWVYRQAGPKDDVIEHIMWGPDQQLYAAGYITHDTGGSVVRDFEILSLDTAGTERWTYREFYGSSYDIACGTDQNLYATGLTTHHTYTEFTVVSTDLSGNERWVCRCPRAGDVNSGRAIVAGTDGNIYTAGYMFGLSTQLDVAVVGLSPTVGLRGRAGKPRSGRMMMPTLVRGALRLPGIEPASFFDISGRRVMDLEAGLNDIRHVAPGVYFIGVDPRSQGSEGPRVRKVVIQK
ncbi:MAG: hypothetical protein JSU73_04690 [candidate division WOR-3 bacterium]|nr:MAG: hypothetical protein JSU73_04690 [candidate division WOR-3 bacterium]